MVEKGMDRRPFEHRAVPALVRRLLMALAVAAAVSLMAAGCTPKPYSGKARDLHREMGTGQDDVQAPALTPAPPALGPEAPYLPLVRPPNVRRAWVRAHLNEAGDLIAGHWVYLMLEPSSWYLRYQGPQELKLKLLGRAPIALPPPEGQ